MNHAVPISIGLLFALPILAGCGDSTPKPLTPTAHVLEFQTQQDTKDETAAAPVPAVGSDPLTAGAGKLARTDPLDAGGDALERGAPAEQDPLERGAPPGQHIFVKGAPAGEDALEQGLPLGQDSLSSAGTDNTYWLRGSIEGGEVAITLDGIPLGRFAVHMDQQITGMIHPGTNTLTFTPIPDFGDAPVEAHIEVINGQMQPGEAPLQVYDTRQAGILSTPDNVASPLVSKPANDKAKNSSATFAPPLPTLGMPKAATPNPSTTLTFDAD